MITSSAFLKTFSSYTNHFFCGPTGVISNLDYSTNHIVISQLGFIGLSLSKKAELLEMEDNRHIANKFLAYSRHLVNAQWKTKWNNIQPQLRPS